MHEEGMRLGGSLALHISNHDYLQVFLQVRVHVHRGHVPRVGEATLFDAGEDGLCLLYTSDAADD